MPDVPSERPAEQAAVPYSPAARVVDDGWTQGSVIPWVGPLAREVTIHGVRQADLTADGGRPARPDETPDGWFVLLSQACDLAASLEREPMAVALPAGPWNPDDTSARPDPNTPRYFPAEFIRPGWAVTYTRVVEFPKQDLPPGRPTAAIDEDGYAPMAFAMWAARRWRRVPVDDSVRKTIIEALIWVLKRSPWEIRARVLSWRLQGWAEHDGTSHGRLFAIYRESDADPDLPRRMDEAVAAVETNLRARLPSLEAKYRKVVPLFTAMILEGVVARSTSVFSLESTITIPMLELDDLSAGLEASEDGHPPELLDDVNLI